MTENFGAYLQQHKANKEAVLRKQADLEAQKQRASYNAAVNEAAAYLVKLRQEIPEDVKSEYRSDNGRLTYVLRNLLVRDRGWETSMDTRYYLGTPEIWAGFVDWAKEHGLLAAIWEESHSEYNKDDGYSVHDYYYIILRPLQND
jgi:hypothetical protein